jgi:hypothetical protein
MSNSPAKSRGDGNNVIIVAAKNVPTKIVGVARPHWHTYLVESDAAFLKRSGANQAPGTSPGAFKYTTGVTEAN